MRFLVIAGSCLNMPDRRHSEGSTLKEMGCLFEFGSGLLVLTLLFMSQT